MDEVTLIMKNLPLFSALFLSIFLTAAPIHAANSCHSIFSQPQALEETVLKTTGIYSKEPVYSLDRNIHDINLREKLLASEHDGKFDVTLVKLQYPEGLAYLYFREIPGTNAIIIDMVSVPPSLRGKGISNRLFSMVFDRLPKVDKIIFELDMTNRELFDKNKEVSLENGLVSTPIYRSLSKFGFTIIDHISEIKIRGKTFPHITMSRQSDH